MWNQGWEYQPDSKHFTLMYILARQIKSHNFIFIGIMASCGRDIRPKTFLFCVAFSVCGFNVRMFFIQAIKIYPNMYLNFYFDQIGNSTKTYCAAIEVFMDISHVYRVCVNVVFFHFWKGTDFFYSENWQMTHSNDVYFLFVFVEI